MKNFFKFLGIIALVAVIGFSMIACDSGNGDGTPQTVTYTGTANSVTYSLKITENLNRAAYTPVGGDTYELAAGAKKSTGSVNSISNGVLTLSPSEAPETTFTATVSGSSIIAMSGTITWDGGSTDTAPDFNPPGSNDPFENKYPEASFPALTGGSDFIGTWTGGSNYTLTLVADGTWNVKLAGYTTMSGRFLVSGNTAYFYLLEGGEYYRNSYGTRTENTMAMNGGLKSLGGETWTKQDGTPPVTGDGIIGKWYESQQDANTDTNVIYEFRADNKFLVGGVDAYMTYSISENTITVFALGIQFGTATFSIDGNVMTVVNTSDGTGVSSGTYYKPAS